MRLIPGEWLGHTVVSESNRAEKKIVSTLGVSFIESECSALRDGVTGRALRSRPLSASKYESLKSCDMAHNGTGNIYFNYTIFGFKNRLSPFLHRYIAISFYLSHKFVNITTSKTFFETAFTESMETHCPGRGN